jgi:hypothetical protein
VVLLIGLLLALPQPALAVENVPKPRLRPAESAASPGVATIPLPKPKPSREKEPPGQTPPPAAAEPRIEPRTWADADIREARLACGKLLQGLDVDFEPLDPIGQPGGCGAPAPVRVTRVAGVALAPDATLTCDMAAALHGWVSGTLQPAARERLGTEVSAIKTATSYACRRRNNSSSGKMSEHSRANALDMAGFTFAATGKGVAVGGGKWGEGILASLGVSREGSFLETIRKGACAHFTTVLGPGSDPYHGDHFHVDVLRRKGDYRICQ